VITVISAKKYRRRLFSVHFILLYTLFYSNAGLVGIKQQFQRIILLSNNLLQALATVSNMERPSMPRVYS